MERSLRYVELDSAGRPFHENWKSWTDGPTEAEVWAELTTMTTERGHKLVRITTSDPKRDRNPRLNEIEGDGKGNIRAKAASPDALTGIRIVKEDTRA